MKLKCENEMEFVEHFGILFEKAQKDFDNGGVPILELSKIHKFLYLSYNYGFSQWGDKMSQYRCLSDEVVKKHAPKICPVEEWEKDIFRI